MSSAVSSPTSSPNPARPLTTLLSPRSNLKTLLAGIDDSSDEDGREPANHTSPAKRTKVTRPLPSNDDEDASEDDEVLLPRGRLAARMQANKSNAQPDSASPQGARDRMRKLLGLGSEAKPHQPASTHEDEEEDDILTRHPRRPKTAPRPSSRASTPARDSSPDLFVTPSKQAAYVENDNGLSEDEGGLPSDPLKSTAAKDRLLELQRKRIAREAAAEENRKNQEQRDDGSVAELSVDESDNITDDEGGRKLTQEVALRPSARKAGKKALEEMHRESQRLSRSLQLAHEAKIKKKITKASLFERFNFKPATTDASLNQAVPTVSSSRPSTPVSTHHTDVEMSESHTPPSSPPAFTREREEQKSLTTAQAAVDGNQEQLLAHGEATAPEPKAKRQFRVTLPTTQVVNSVTVDSDGEDLVVLDAKKSKLDALFESVPARRKQNDGAMQALRVLAQLGGSPGKEQSSRRGGKFGPVKQCGMTSAQLELTLHQRAREQARVERERRFEALRARGVHIQTEEERERERQDVENILAAARREAEEIMRREKEEDKAERSRSGEVDPLAWDDSDEDGDYGEVAEEDQPVEDVEISGSEDEDADVESGAEDDADDGEEASGDDVLAPGEQLDDQEFVTTSKKARHARKLATVISDDEDDEDTETPQPAVAPTPTVEATPRSKAPSCFKSPSAQTAGSPFAPQSVLRSATKTFIPGLPVKAGEAAGLGLTQIFAGTMDDSQADPFISGSCSEPRPTFGSLGQPTFPHASHAEQPDDVITSSEPTQQPADEESQSAGVNFAFNTQTQVHGLDSLMRDDVFTQPSQLPEATQDCGFQDRTPLKLRFIDLPQSTVETMAADNSSSRAPSAIPESPVAHRKRLRRVAVQDQPEDDEHHDDDDDDDAIAVDSQAAEQMTTGTASESVRGSEEATNAFGVLSKASRREARREAFDKKKSKAKDMIQEQAEESEDEYAGLGGVDGEDSDDDGEDVKDMIDDQTKASEAEKAKLAAIHAIRERAEDEKQVEKLFRDITSGMLRRKRGADYGDLSDEDDGGEARRRMKRRQFAKMQKALFADERISKVAENPRTSAFMRTIEDRSDDEDMSDILAPSESQEQEQDDAVPDSQPLASQSAMTTPLATGRAPGPLRRRGDIKKPSNLGEIRESLSNLLEDHHNSLGSVIPGTELDSDSDEAGCEEDMAEARGRVDGPGGNKENRNARRRAAEEVAVVDRISLKRSGSSASSTDGSSSSSGGEVGSRGRRAAFAAGSGSGSFKVPALLRRATTNSSLAAGSGNGVSSSTGSGISASSKTMSKAAVMSEDSSSSSSSSGKVKKNASKRSGINYFARENERLAALAEKDRRREQRKFKGAEGRSKVVGGLFAAGKFE